MFSIKKPCNRNPKKLVFNSDISDFLIRSSSLVNLIDIKKFNQIDITAFRVSSSKVARVSYPVLMLYWKVFEYYYLRVFVVSSNNILLIYCQKGY